MPITSESIETAAQLFEDYPSDTAEIGLILQDDLTAYYRETGMLEHSPEKANFLITRGQRSAAWTAMWHTSVSQVIHDILPALESGAGIAPHAVPKKRGPYHAFVNTVGHLLLNGFYSVLDRDTDTGGAVQQDYRPLWEYVGSMQEEYKLRWIDLKRHADEAGSVVPLSPPMQPQGKEKITAIWEGSVFDIAMSALWVLTNQRLSSQEKDPVSPKELTRYALAGVPRTSWATSINRSVNLRGFPNLFEDPPEDLDHTFFEAPYKVFIPSGSGDAVPCKWAHASLRSGPWKSPGWCAGNAIIRGATEAARNDIEQLCKMAEEISGVSIPRRSDGSLSSGTAVLIMGAFAGEHTIF